MRPLTLSKSRFRTFWALIPFVIIAGAGAGAAFFVPPLQIAHCVLAVDDHTPDVSSNTVASFIHGRLVSDSVLVPTYHTLMDVPHTQFDIEKVALQLRSGLSVSPITRQKMEVTFLNDGSEYVESFFRELVHTFLQTPSAGPPSGIVGSVDEDISRTRENLSKARDKLRDFSLTHAGTIEELASNHDALRDTRSRIESLSEERHIARSRVDTLESFLANSSAHSNAHTELELTQEKLNQVDRKLIALNTRVAALQKSIQTATAIEQRLVSLQSDLDVQESLLQRKRELRATMRERIASSPDWKAAPYTSVWIKNPIAMSTVQNTSMQLLIIAVTTTLGICVAVGVFFSLRQELEQ